jgi:hypothetical protein
MSFFDREYPGARHKYANQIHYWTGSDNIRNFANYQPNPYADNSITYSFNEHGFRSDPFESNDHRMLFMGCSFTEGVGLPLEETYSSIIHQEIQQRLGVAIPYWNLGLGGCGLDTIVRCYYDFYQQLRPQVVIALLPAYRLEYKNQFDSWQPLLVHHDDQQIFANNPYLLEPQVIRYSIEKNFAMWDLMLQANNTLLIWDYWALTEFKDVDTSQLQSFNNGAESWLKLSYLAGQAKIPNYARDGMHPGRVLNRKFASSLLDHYGDRICERLTQS